MSEFALITLVSISVFAALAAGITAVGATPAAGDYTAALPCRLWPRRRAPRPSGRLLVSALSVRPGPAPRTRPAWWPPPDHALPPNLTPPTPGRGAGAARHPARRRFPLTQPLPPAGFAGLRGHLRRGWRLRAAGATSNASTRSRRARTSSTRRALRRFPDRDAGQINNAVSEVANRPLLGIGQRLRILPRDGLLYEVRLGDSVQAIARKADVAADAIVAEPANRLATADLLRRPVLLPGASRLVVGQASTPRPTAASLRQRRACWRPCSRPHRHPPVSRHRP
ncbi:MAG: hypothetical protein U0531_06885 [Dehalococcoidia bacterium]